MRVKLLKIKISVLVAMTTGNGVLSGKGVSVSKLFSADDRKIAIQVVKEHGGKVQLFVAHNLHAFSMYSRCYE